MGTALASPNVRHIALTAMQHIKSRGGTLSFDPNLRPELLHDPHMKTALDQVLAHTNLFLPSGEELYLFTTATTETAAITELLARGIDAVILKRGNQGASYYALGETHHAAPIAITETDPTGAGDSFGGAFISLWHNGADAATALHYANAAGARAATTIGPMEGTSTLVELEALINRTTQQ